MSIGYNLVEKACFLLNDYRNNYIKNIIYRAITSNEENKIFLKLFARIFKMKRFSYQGFPVIRIEKRTEKKFSKVILFLAGGGGIARPKWVHFDVVKRLAESTGARIYLAYYPLAPEYNAIQALAWLEQIYSRIIKVEDTSAITIMGDSAGANLAISLVNMTSKKPGKIILISPAPGLGNQYYRGLGVQKEKEDPLLSVKLVDTITDKWLKNVPLSNSPVEPLNISYKAFPPMLLFYGEHEIFEPQVKKLVQKMNLEKADVIVVKEPMCHDWALCSFFPEGKAAIRKIQQFICS